MGFYRYYCSGSDMSADIKRVVKRVRAKHPEYFAARELRESAMDGEGRVTVTLRRDVMATPMPGRARHELSMRTYGQ